MPARASHSGPTGQSICRRGLNWQCQGSAQTSRSTWSSSAPGSWASTSSTGPFRQGTRCGCSSRPTASAAPGTGTATQGAGSTPRATPTGTCSRRSSGRSGTGRRSSPPQPETERYLNHVVDKFDLRRHIRLEQQGHVGGVGRGQQPPGRPAPRTGFEVTLAVPRDRTHRRAVGAAVPRRARARGLRRARPTTRSAGRRTPVDFKGKRVAVDRHRLDRRPDRARDRGRGRVADDVPAQRRPGATPLNNHPIDAEPAGVPQGELRADQGRARRLGRRLPAQAGRARSGSTTRRSSGRRSSRASGTAPGSPRSAPTTRTCCSTPRPTPTGAPSWPDKIRGDRRRPGHRGQADPDRPPLRRPAPAVRHRLLRDVQPAQRRAGRRCARPRSSRSPRPGSRPRTGCASSTSSSGRPASTSAPAPCCGWASSARAG